MNIYRHTAACWVTTSQPNSQGPPIEHHWLSTEDHLGASQHRSNISPEYVVFDVLRHVATVDARSDFTVDIVAFDASVDVDGTRHTARYSVTREALADAAIDLDLIARRKAIKSLARHLADNNIAGQARQVELGDLGPWPGSPRLRRQWTTVGEVHWKGVKFQHVPFDLVDLIIER